MLLIYGLVVQLVRMPPCHGGGREFESHPGRHKKISGKIDYNRRYGVMFFGITKAYALVRLKDFKSFGFATLRGTGSNLIQVSINFM